MKDLFDFALRIITATLFLYLINSVFYLNIPYNYIYIILIAFLKIPGLIIVLLLTYLF